VTTRHARKPVACSGCAPIACIRSMRCESRPHAGPWVTRQSSLPTKLPTRRARAQTAWAILSVGRASPFWMGYSCEVPKQRSGAANLRMQQSPGLHPGLRRWSGRFDRDRSSGCRGPWREEQGPSGERALTVQFDTEIEPVREEVLVILVVDAHHRILPEDIVDRVRGSGDPVDPDSRPTDAG